jgi:hypothetical protein
MERRFEQPRLGFRRISVCVAFVMLLVMCLAYLSLDGEPARSAVVPTALKNLSTHPRSKSAPDAMASLDVNGQSFADLGSDLFQRRRFVLLLSFLSLINSLDPSLR